MKIPLTNGTVADTDKMTDSDAEINEAVKRLYDLCVKYDRTVFAKVILGPRRHIGVTAYTKSNTQDEFAYLMDTIAAFVAKATGGQFAIVKVEQ